MRAFNIGVALLLLISQQANACKCSKQQSSIEASFQGASWVVLAQAGKFTRKDESGKTDFSVINSWKGDIPVGGKFDYGYAPTGNMACKFVVNPQDQYLLLLFPIVTDGVQQSEKIAFDCNANRLVNAELQTDLTHELDALAMSSPTTDKQSLWRWVTGLFRRHSD